jgi:hypothetical protein
MEASGTVVRLPTDESVLNHPEFKKRGFSLGRVEGSYCQYELLHVVVLSF